MIFNLRSITRLSRPVDLSNFVKIPFIRSSSQPQVSDLFLIFFFMLRLLKLLKTIYFLLNLILTKPIFIY